MDRANTQAATVGVTREVGVAAPARGWASGGTGNTTAKPPPLTIHWHFLSIFKRPNFGVRRASELWSQRSDSYRLLQAVF